VGGRLIGLTHDGELRVRTRDDEWAFLGTTPGLATLTGTTGRLVGATPGGDLFWRELVGGAITGPSNPLAGDAAPGRPRPPAGEAITGHPQTGNNEE